MKRKELEARINSIAKANGLKAVWTEGGNHSKLVVGRAQTVVPRHREINEITAKSIIRYVERNCR